MADEDIVDLPLFEREAITALRRIATALEGQRDDLKNHPNYEMSEMMLQNMRAQLRGGIVAAPGIIKGH